MVPADKDRLRSRIDHVRSRVRRLKEIAETDRERFLGNDLLQAASVRYLQTGIEALLDIGNHLVAREGLGTPRSYQEVIDLLIEHGILRTEDRTTYREMVRFRNRAVHLYEEIDAAEIYQILQENLGDFETFVSAIVDRYFSEG
ncbi:MAG: type VII toxin-antitoxin system HepT family RNase toxin [Vicinamibacteria bacterium]